VSDHPEITGFREFEFDLPDALLRSMVATFDVMESALLDLPHLAKIPDAQGVYQLLVGEEIVYIGKTDSEAGLAKRLERHAWTIQHRSNLSVESVSFKAVRVYVFTAIDLETQLIKHYKSRSSIGWNNSGFGSNDPGRNRDDTRANPTSFDVLFPIDLDQEIELDVVGDMTAASALQELRRKLPYTVRSQSAPGNPRAPHPDLESARLIVPRKPTTTRQMMALIVASLPPGWQATALAGRIILYSEHKDYASGMVIARS
jgi:hypothetical protein